MKLQLGDIELDSGSPPAASQHAAQPLASRASRRSSALERQRLIVALALGASLAPSVLVFFGRLPSWGLLISLSELMALSVALLVMARLRRAPSPADEEDEAAAKPAALDQERASRVLRALGAMGPTGASFRELERALGWVEPVLAQTLRAMIASDQIEEELDIETGHWSYKISQQVRFGWDELEDDASVSLAQRLERAFR